MSGITQSMKIWFLRTVPDDILFEIQTMELS